MARGPNALCLGVPKYKYWISFFLFFLLFLSPRFSEVLVLMISYLKTFVTTRINRNDDDL